MVSGRSKSRSRSKKAVPPSRVRYEKANPAVTVRIPSELRDRLAEMKDEHGLSLGDVLRIGLEKAGPDIDTAYQRGMDEGYNIAKDEYEVTTGAVDADVVTYPSELTRRKKRRRSSCTRRAGTAQLVVSLHFPFGLEGCKPVTVTNALNLLRPTRPDYFANHFPNELLSTARDQASYQL